MKKTMAACIAVFLMSMNVFGGEIGVRLNDEDVVFPRQEPVIIEERVFIPIRGIFEKLGYKVEWNAEQKSAVFTGDTNEIVVTADSNYFTVNGESVPLELPARIVSGSMLLPLRAVGEAAGLTVSWDPARKMAVLSGHTIPVDSVVSGSALQPYDYNISQEDIEAIRNVAGAIITINMISSIASNFMSEAEYIDYKLDGTEYYDGSYEEIEKILNDGADICDTYNKIAGRIEARDGSAEFLESFRNLLTSQKNSYIFLRDLILTDKYDEILEDESDTQFIDPLFDIYAATEKFMGELGKEYNNLLMAADDSSISEYIAPDDDINEAEKQIIDDYSKEIGEAVTEALSFIAEDDYYKRSDRFFKAADTIRRKLDMTKTPSSCIVDRETLYMGCSLLERMGEDINCGFDESNFHSEYSVDFFVCLDAFEMTTDVLSVGEYINYNKIFGIEDIDDESDMFDDFLWEIMNSLSEEVAM